MQTLTLPRHITSTRSGIYLIYCKQAKLCYIGQTKRNFSTRWREHLALLRAQRHYNDKLQAAYDTYGSRAIDFAILEVVTDYKRLDEKERFWISKLGFANERK